jgi:hypothetical protein
MKLRLRATPIAKARPKLPGAWLWSCAIVSSSFPLGEGAWAALAGADLLHLGDVIDEDLAIARVAGRF